MAAAFTHTCIKGRFPIKNVGTDVAARSLFAHAKSVICREIYS